MSLNFNIFLFLLHGDKDNVKLIKQGNRLTEVALMP